MTTNFTLQDGPVWAKIPDFFENLLQPTIILTTQANQQVVVPAITLLASSLVLRQVISENDQPVASIAPVVIVPSVTVEILKHVAEIVTTGKCNVGDRDISNEVEDVLNMLQIMGEFECETGKVNREYTSKNGFVIKLENEELIIKMEFDDTNGNNLNSEDDETEPDVYKDETESDVNENETSPKDKDKTEDVDRKSLHQMQKRHVLRRSSRNAEQDKNGSKNMHESRQFKRKAKSGDHKKVNKVNELNSRNPAKHEEKIHKCPHCDYTTTCSSNMSHYKKAVHEGKPHACSQCSFKTLWYGGLKRHKQSEHEDAVYCCDSCDYKSKVEEYFKYHKRRRCPGKQE